jgi:imidazole glycerol-phosphate synthase subunit HisF
MKHKKVRLISRLDIKGPNLIKGIHLEGLRVIGDPQEYAKKYYLQGADELIYIDIVASLYGRSKLPEIVSRTVEEVFIPLTVGGGIRSVDDVKELLRAGADKVAINSAAVQRPDLINEVSRRFGSQCMVLSIEAKKQTENTWEVYTDSGRERTGIDVIDWTKEGVLRGAGEILLTSIDAEGTKKGFDIDLIKAVTEVTNIPVIASGGMGSFSHLEDAIKIGDADAIAMADILHYERSTIPLIRDAAKKAEINVREHD